ncbi:MAG: caspase family protein, partial [Geminicoccaceae bacterium]
MHSWSAAAEERWALLIGNEDYSVLPSLSNPVNDISNLAERLEALSFNVVMHQNLEDSAAMGTAVLEFATDAKAAGAEAVLVHYAGHGFEIAGENYLVPTGIVAASEPALTQQLAEMAADEPLKEEDRQIRLGEMRLEHVRTQSLKLNEVLGLVEQAAPTRILLFDACRDVPDMRNIARSDSPETANTGFTVAKGSAGTMITFSAQPGQVASDGSGPVSPFMQAMLDHIDVRGIDVNDLMTRVRKDVHAYTEGDQVPWTHSALLEAFSFRPVPEGYYGDQNVTQDESPEKERATLSAADANADEQHWQRIANSFDVDAYHGYLQKFPNGTHVEEAQQLLSRLGVLYDEGEGSAKGAGADLQVAANEPASRQFDADDGVRKRIVILGDSDFVADRLPNAGDRVVGLPDALVDRIAANLSTSPRFELLERQALRRVISEQRFDRKLGESYLEKTFEQSFGDVRPNGGDVVIIPDSNPVDGSGIVAGSGLGSSAATADYLDLLKDFKDLGSSIGAEYLVFGRLESVDHEVQKRKIPYTERAHVDETLSARLRLRIVDVEQAKIIGAVALESEIESEVFKDGPSAVRSAMFERLAREVTGALVDSFHQATVIQAGPMVVDRGAIHGVEPGSTFTIEREGADELVSQDGIKLGGHKSYVATVQVVAVDDLWSEVELIDGEQPALH